MHPALKKRTRGALNKICNDPYVEKALKDELSGLRSFRIKHFRVIYRLVPDVEIQVVAIGPRKSIYKETFRLLKKSDEVQ
jgi:mRNA-degrading endonuclease RelE of RelBE toxin-antitoxin system